MADSSGQAELKRNYPVTTGLDATSKHEGRQINLVPSQGSNYPSRKKLGL